MRFHTLLIMILGLFSLLTACGGGDDKVCDPGETQRCHCPDGEDGSQVCSDDGTKWKSCQGCEDDDDQSTDGDDDQTTDGDDDQSTDGDGDQTTDGDNDPTTDGDNDPTTDGDDDQATDGDDDQATDGDEESDTDGDLDEDTQDVAESEAEAEVEEEEEPLPTGRCSASNVICTANDDCSPAQVTLQGFCIVRDDNAGYSCGFESYDGTGSTVTCEGQTVGHCEDDIDCMLGTTCGYYGSNWCEGNTADGICRNYTIPGADPCTNDNLCQIEVDNVCVICGNGQVDSAQEECDDSNTDDNDGCSSTCRFEGECRDNSNYPTDHECATDNDCIDGCYDSPCTCHFD